MTATAGLIGFWNYRENTYSKDDLKLEILGPEEIVLGQELEYTVKFKNNGNFRLEKPELIFEPPANALLDEELLGRQILSSEELGEAIYPGQEKTFSFKMRLLGKEGETKTARVSLSCQPKDLKARYEWSSSFTTIVKSVPLTFEFDLPSKIEPEKDFKFQLNYFSNIDYLLTNLGIQVEYPPDFEFIKSSPPALEKTEWEIPVLNKFEGGRIDISGRLSGEVGGVKVFKAKLGVWQEGEFILLKEIVKGVEIVNPSIYLRQEINGNPQYVALPGDWLHYEIYFQNVGKDALSNLFLVNKLEGEAFDFETMRSDLGILQPGDDSVVFDWKKVRKLQYLTPTEEGKVDFWIKLKDDFERAESPVLKNKVFISQIKEEFTTKISSKLEISQKGYFQDEVFGNSGPLPPKVGERTTYTIIWQIKNYYSDVKNVKVRAVLPQRVEVTGKIFPEEESSKFTFDSQSREIVWSVGDLEEGRGVSEAGPNIAFQIALTPVQSQRGQSPEIIGQAKTTGEDTWTEINLEATASSVNTSLPDDSTVTGNQGIVQ